MWHLDVFSTIHEDDRGRLAQKIAEVFAQGYAEGEGRVLTKAGARWYYFLARKMMVGDEAYIVGTGIDITDRKRAEESLIVSEESYRAIFNTANDAIFVHDIETGQVVDVNDKACEMYVYPKEEMLTLSPAAIARHRRAVLRPHRVRDRRGALRFINDLGFCFAFTGGPGGLTGLFDVLATRSTDRMWSWAWRWKD